MDPNYSAYSKDINIESNAHLLPKNNLDQINVTQIDQSANLVSVENSHLKISSPDSISTNLLDKAVDSKDVIDSVADQLSLIKEKYVNPIVESASEFADSTFKKISPNYETYKDSIKTKVCDLNETIVQKNDVIFDSIKLGVTDFLNNPKKVFVNAISSKMTFYFMLFSLLFLTLLSILIYLFKDSLKNKEKTLSTVLLVNFCYLWVSIVLFVCAEHTDRVFAMSISYYVMKFVFLVCSLVNSLAAILFF